MRGRLRGEPLDQVAKRFDERADRYGDDEFHNWLAAQTATWAGASPGRVLDVGAGTGRVSGHLRGRAGSPPAVLLDVSEGMLQAARQRDPAAHVVCADAHRLPFGEAAFDRVVCVAVDSFLNLVEFGAEAARVLRPGGDLVMTVWADPPAVANRVADAAAQAVAPVALTIRKWEALTWPPTSPGGSDGLTIRRCVVFSARREPAP